MWGHERDRTDDPARAGWETRRLARDEYDRPRYGSASSAAGPRSAHPSRQETPPEREHVPQRGDGRELDRVRVHELMTRQVATVQPGTSVEHAAQAMERCDCGALPVVGDNGLLVGVVTDRDIAMRIVAGGRDTRGSTVGDCMTGQVFSCYANESVTECMHQMAQHKVRRMPIVDERGKLVGIVSQGDLARHAARQSLPGEHRVLADVLGAVSQPGRPPYR